LRRYEEVVAEELHPREQHLPLGDHSVMDKAFSETDNAAEGATDLYDTAYGEHGEHDNY